MSRGGIKQTKEDKRCSLLVRSMWDWRCSTPGLSPNCIHEVDASSPDRQRLHASHLIGRGHYATRWLPTNQIAQCLFCHNHAEDRKHLIEGAARDAYGDEAVDFVFAFDRAYEAVGSALRRAKPFAKGSAWREQIHLWLKAQIDEIGEARKRGRCGVIATIPEPFIQLVEAYGGQEVLNVSYRT